MPPAAVLYHTQVMHQRLLSPTYRFRYRVFSLLVDIDQLDRLQAEQRWLSVDRFNLFSLRTRDHGPRNGQPWRPWIEARLAEHGIDLQGGRIQLLAIPRILGYAFNPLSLWYCAGSDGRLRAVLLEVRNTFGEHHHYLLHQGGAALPNPIRGRKQKIFHVSPFIDMQPVYHFRLEPPGPSLRITIQEYQAEQRLLVATQSGRAEPCNNRTLLKVFLRQPWAAAKIMVLIHWQALRIWLRGGRIHSKPTPPAQEMS